MIDHVDVRSIPKTLAYLVSVVCGVELIGNLPTPSILEIIRIFLLQADVPIKAVLASVMRKIVLFFAETSPQSRECRSCFFFRWIPRDDIDNAACSICTVQSGCRTLQDLDALNRGHIGKLSHRHFAIRSRTAIDIGSHPIDENHDMIRAVEHQPIRAVGLSRIPVDGNRYARHIPQCFLHAGVMPLFNHVPCDNIDIGVCLKGFHWSARRRDHSIIQDFFFHRLGLSIPRNIL